MTSKPVFSYKAWSQNLANMHDSARGPTRIVDSQGRLFIFRSRVTQWQKDCLPQLAAAIQRFAEATQQTVQDREKNRRGMHEFCIAGHDRQRKTVGYPN